MTSLDVAHKMVASSASEHGSGVGGAEETGASAARSVERRPSVNPAGQARASGRVGMWRGLMLARRIVPFLMVHVAALSVFFVHFSWLLVALTVAVYCFLLIGTAAWMHRYFSHRTFKTSRWFQAVLGFWAGCACQRGTLWWSAHHRRHHAFADTEDDLHSPTLRMFWKSHVAWIWEDEAQATNTKWVRDLARFPELVWLDRWYWVPPLMMWGLIAGLGAWWGAATGIGAIAGAASFFAWGALLGTVISWHALFCINSVTHMWGRQRYDTGDNSLNNTLVSWLVFGEGWHNNHHYYQHSANIGFHRWEIDMGYWAIVAAEKLGLVWDVHRAPPKAVNGEYRHAMPRRETLHSPD